LGAIIPNHLASHQSSFIPAADETYPSQLWSSHASYCVPWPWNPYQQQYVDVISRQQDRVSLFYHPPSTTIHSPISTKDCPSGNYAMFGTVTNGLLYHCFGWYSTSYCMAYAVGDARSGASRLHIVVITLFLHQLHWWLKFPWKIDFKLPVGILIYKCLYSLAPSYLVVKLHHPTDTRSFASAFCFDTWTVCLAH